jgi:hypothetical protein
MAEARSLQLPERFRIVENDVLARSSRRGAGHNRISWQLGRPVRFG